jgi:hypothetical protein
MPHSQFVSAAEVYKLLPADTARRLHALCKRHDDRPIDVLIDAIEEYLGADEPVLFDVVPEDLARAAP